MKTLELQEMEEMNGGSINCALAAAGAVGFGIAVAGATGGFGAVAYAGWMLSAFSVGGALGSCAYELS